MDANIHPFYRGIRIYFFVSYIPLLLAFTLQLYRDRHDLRDRAQWNHVTRISRVSGWIGCVLAMIANVDFYTVFDIYPPLLTSVVYSFSVCFAYLPLVLAGYRATLAAAAFLSHSQRRVFSIITKVLFFNTGPVVMLSLVVAIISHRTATGLFNCISGVLAYPTLAIGVNVMYFLLRDHYNKLSKVSGDSKSSRSLAVIMKNWRSHAVYVTIIMALVTIAYVKRFQVTIRQVRAGTVVSTAADATAVADPSRVPNIGGLVLPIAVQLCIITLLWRSWRTRDSSNSEPRLSNMGPPSDEAKRTSNANGITAASANSTGTANANRHTKSQPTQTTRNGTIDAAGTDVTDISLHTITVTAPVVVSPAVSPSVPTASRGSNSSTVLL